MGHIWPPVRWSKINKSETEQIDPEKSLSSEPVDLEPGQQDAHFTDVACPTKKTKTGCNTWMILKA